jgi:hypothetical protein
MSFRGVAVSTYPDSALTVRRPQGGDLLEET